MEQSVSLDVGDFTGQFENGRPHGNGMLRYRDDDIIGRDQYNGEWFEGVQHGKGAMTFKSGDVYRGDFRNGVPEGDGEFRYVNGDVETAVWKGGERCGLSVYKSETCEEHISFTDGVAHGPSTYKNFEDGSIEEREFVNGCKFGPATVKFSNGDYLELNYSDNLLNGGAKLHFLSKGLEETCHYVNGVKHGNSTELKIDSGDREERTYVDGQLEGDATVIGTNGDRLEFKYKESKRRGAAVYFWSDGSIETSIFNNDGIETGPARLTWPNGAVREGCKLNGLWHGDVFYTYAEGPRKGKKDLETWKDGKMVESKKFYGDDSAIIKDWEDLKKLEELTK